MASRRGIGAGLSSASNTIASLIDAYIKDELSAASQMRQNKYVTDRQAENNTAMADRQEALARLQSALGRGDKAFGESVTNPGYANRVAANLGGKMPEDPNAIPFSANAQRPEEAFQDLYAKNIAGANTPESLPSEQTVRMLGQNSLPLQAAGAAPQIDELIKARNEKEAAITAEAQAKEDAKPRYNPQADAMGFMGRNATFIPTERNAIEAGQAEHTKKLLSDLSPDVLGIQARQARAIAQNQEGGQLDEQSGRLGDLRAITDATTRTTGGGMGGAAGLNAVLGPALRMVQLAEAINTNDSPGGVGDIQGELKYQFGNRLGGSLQSAAKSNPAIVELDSLRAGLRGLIPRLLGHTGVLTETDSTSAMEIAPDRGLRKGDSDVRNRNFLNFLTAASKFGAQLPPIDPSASPAQQQADLHERFQTLMGMYKSGQFGGQSLPGQAAQTGTIQGDQIVIGGPQ